MTIMLLPERSVEDRLEEPRLEPQLDTLQAAIGKEGVLNEECQLCHNKQELGICHPPEEVLLGLPLDPEQERERKGTSRCLPKLARASHISHSPLYNLLELPADFSTLLVGLGGLSPELVRDRITLDLPEGNFTLLMKVCIQDKMEKISTSTSYSAGAQKGTRSNNLTHPSLMSISCCFLFLFSIKEVGSNLGTLAPVGRTPTKYLHVPTH